MSRRKRSSGRRRLRAVWAALTAVLVGLPLMVGLAVPAAAQDPEGFLELTKGVTQAEVGPGDEFTYDIAVACQQASCVEAELNDTLPEELAGFPITDVTTQPGQNSVPRQLTWNETGTDQAPDVISENTAFTVAFTGPTANPEGTGFEPGTTFSISITVQVPGGQPGDPIPVENTVFASADNADTVEDTATVQLSVPVDIQVEASKSWGPTPQFFEPGAPSTIELGAQNNSNLPVDTLVLQEPADAANGATTLSAANPFTITDFTGFGDASLPAGAETMQVDAYVFQDGAWNWVSGAPGPTPALPGGVETSDVGGLRITYAEDVEVDANAGIEFNLEQRDTHRNTDGDLSLASHTVGNVASGTATLEGFEDVTDEATATYTVNPVDLSVTAAKNISPDQITAGQSADATINATNTSPVGMSELRVSDLGFFTSEITFGGFSAAPVWPAGADAAEVLFHPLDGGDPVSVSFGSGETPQLPDGLEISGFEVVFTSAEGSIAPEETTNLAFAIDTSEDATDGADQIVAENTAQTRVTAPNGATAEDTDDDTLTIINPAVFAEIAKTVRPSAAVQPGATVISSLQANASTSSPQSTLREIIVEDSWGEGEDEFWNAFNLSAIAPTQVPGGTSLTIQVQGPDGLIEVATHGPETGATIFQMTSVEIQNALPDGVDITDLTGIQFSFTNEAGFAADTTVTPNVVSAARSELRTDGPTTPEPETPTTYENTATVAAEGVSDGDAPLTDEDADTGTGTIITFPGDPGPVHIDKAWQQAGVSAQSSQNATTELRWAVAPGLQTVTISDPAVGYNDPAGTVFEAFDLISIDPIAADNEPFSTGWYLQYDTITAVEIYDGEWQAVPAPAEGWIQNGAFAGYDLSADEQLSTTGVRLVLGENEPAREAAQGDGDAFDPFAPAPGSGVGHGSTNRVFELTWQVRDQTRPAGEWVTDAEFYNTDDAGVVDNTTALDGVLYDGDEVHGTAGDTITILNPGPGVNVAKSVDFEGEEVFTPLVATDPSEYPTATFTLVANNDSTARASHIRVTDPAPCPITDTALCASDGTIDGALANPYTGDVDWLNPEGGQENPFNRFDLTGVTIEASIADEVDLDESTVWLLRYVGGEYTTEQTTASAVNDLDAEALADVIGISVTFQDTDLVTSGGTITEDNDLSITLDTVLRSHFRDSGEEQWLQAGQTNDVTNLVFTQSYDPILSDGVVAADTDATTVTLTGGIVDITPIKSVSPDTILEPNPQVPVTVTLGANQGSDPRSTLSPQSVVIEDQADSPDFWNTFDFTGLDEITMPAGAERVQVDVYGPFGDEGAMNWETGTPADAESVELPVEADDYGDIQGIRLTFDRADGEIFSTTLPAPGWQAEADFTVELRETYRDSDEPVPFDREPVENTQTSQSFRPMDGNHSEPVDETAEIIISEGTREIAVRKLANEGNRTVDVGENVPWELTFENTGSGYVTITELVDELPESLVYLGDPAPTYSVDDDGLLSEDVELGVSADGSELTFTWPEDGNQMAPGEQFTIELHLELQPSSGQSVNTFVVHTEEALDSCGNIDGSDNWFQEGGTDNTCGTSDYVEPVDGPNMFNVKGVRGSVADIDDVGGFNPATGAECAPTLNATGGSYFRAPCVAYSDIGGTDDWVLRSQNAGTYPVTELTIFDQLPVEGDLLLLGTDNSRGSAYRPQLVEESLDVTAPEETEIVTEVTTSPDVCVGTWEGLIGDNPWDPCEQAGEEWFEPDEDTDWSAVSGVRISLDFSETDAGALQIGEFVDVTFSTINLPESEQNPGGAPVQVPAEQERAINQFGIQYTNAHPVSGAETVLRLTPSVVGVQLRTAALEVTKQITGPAAELYAAEEFEVGVQCSIGDVEIDMGEFEVLTLSADNDFTARIDGIPYSADPLTDCVVTELGEVGEYGETSRDIDPAGGELILEEPAEHSDEDEPAVPAGQIAVTNDYQFTGLSVTKQLNTEATAGEFGPFDFTLQCTSITGQDVVFDDDGNTLIEFTLEDGETFTAPENRIPVGADCLITETDEFFADEIVIVGDNVEDHGDGSATVTPGTTPAEVTVTNGYDAGTIEVAKLVDGEGADLYGQGPFGFDAVCTYQDQTLLEESIELEPAGTQSFGVFPAGTECEVVETADGGATSTALDPEDGTVVVPSPEDPEENPISQVGVTATNTFELGQLDLVKLIEGDGAELYGEGPFEAQVMCTWDRDGETVDIELPNGGLVTLSADNGYTATVQDLLVGAECIVTETLTGGATSSSIDPEGGTVIVPGNDEDGEQQAVTATLTNTFDLGQLDLVKVIEGAGAELYGAGPFEAQVVCAWERDGEIVDIDLPDDGVVTLSEENGYTAIIEDLLVGAECVVTETLTGGASSSSIDPEGGTVTVPANDEDGEQQAVTATLTNTFDLGQLDLVKVIEGAGAELYGAGPFEAQVVCTWERDGEPVDIELPNEGRVVLSATNGYTATIEDLLVGAECIVTETLTGGATAVSFEPADGTVTVPANDQEGAPQAVTVTLINTFDLGQLELVKVIEGAGAELYGAGPFEAQVMCTWDRDGEGIDIDLPDGGLVELSAANGYTATIDNLLVGADCVVTETLTGGATSSSIDPADGVVTVPGHDDEGAQQAVTATLTNTFDLGQLEIAKLIEGDGAELYGAGPFEAQVICAWDRDGEMVDIELADGGVVTLSQESGYTATIENLLVGAECTVTETLTGGATSSTIDPEDGTVVVPANDEDGEQQAVTVTLTNTFDLGQLDLVKLIEGDGAELYGEGPFEAQVMCTWDRDGEIVDIELPDDGRVELSAANGYEATIQNLIVGADCVVTETLTGGATSSSIDPEGGTVTVPGNDEDGEQQAVTVTLTNTFDLGQLDLVKLIEGAGAELYGEGPFEAQVVCTWERDGEVLDIELPEDGVVSLSEDNAYTATIEDLIVGADCAVTETLTGGATSTSVDPDGGTVIVPANDEAGEQQTVTVTLTNTFDVTSLDVVKEVQGNLDAPGASGPFTVDLACTWDVDGEITEVEIPGGAERDLTEADGFEATYDNLPLGALCQVTETETQDADGTLITVVIEGSDPQIMEGTTAEVDLSATAEPGQALVIVTNAFDEQPVPPTLPDAGTRAGSLAVVAILLVLTGGGALLVRHRMRTSRG